MNNSPVVNLQSAGNTKRTQDIPIPRLTPFISDSVEQEKEKVPACTRNGNSERMLLHH